MRRKWITITALALVAVLSFTAGLMAQRKYTVKLNDKTLKLETLEINGKIWVPLNEITNALGIRYKSDDEKGIINLSAPAKFIVSPRFIVNDDKVLKNRYFFRLSYAQGNFSMDVFVNGKKIGTYNAEADVEVTKYLQPGKNSLEIHYRFAGGHSGFYFALQELLPNKDRTNLEEMDIIYTETSSRPKNGKKVFKFEAQ